MKQKQRWTLPLFVILGIAAVAGAAVLSVLWGSTNISVQDVVTAFINPDWTRHEQIAVLELRLPRTIGDIFVGASFACAGAMMQGVTRNPLADSGLLGINAGASFALALCLAFASSITFGLTVFCSFIGAAASCAVVYGLLQIGHRKADPVRLVLAGSAVSLFLSALSQGVALFYNIGQDLTFWTAGGVAGIRMAQLKIAVPVMIIGLLGAWMLSGKIGVLSLGEDAARGLGLNVERTQTLSLAVVMVLAGAAVALAGPISFVGLLVPYITRFFVGSDYRRVIPCSMITGALCMLLADILSRIINAPSETPIGFIFALLGVPLFIVIARKGKDFEK